MVGKRLIVGVAVNGLTNYGRAILRGVARYANARHGWLLHEDLRLRNPDRHPWPECDGAIIGGLKAKLTDAVCQRTQHIVSCSGNNDPKQFPIVCADSVAIGRIAAEHLIECRLRHFAFYGAGRATISAQRLAGFEAALGARGFSCLQAPLDTLDQNQFVEHSHWPALIDWLQRLPKPVGIFAIDDHLAHDLAAACLAAEIVVPDRVAIIGANNDDLVCETSFPPLSSVEVDFSRVGYLAARQLDGLLHGDKLPAGERVIQVPPLGVVQRLSTNVQAVDDPQLAAAVAFIRDHACDPCDVSDIMREVAVSRSWLERQFAGKLNRTPRDEIVRIRIERARRLLLESDEKIERIAERCGFSATQNFGRVFRQVMGTTPAAFRRGHYRGGV
jgi:LacI family transcriptional regulator